jgi:hypothetical protein
MNRIDTEPDCGDAPSPASPPLAPLFEATGYAGVLPFAAGLLGLVLLPTAGLRELAERGLIAYGAVILAFVGAVHFGLVLAGLLDASGLRIAGAILPSVTGATAVLLGDSRALGLLVVGFGTFWLYEHRSCAAQLPPGYLALRRNLSLAVCLLLAMAMIAADGAGFAWNT